MTDLKDFLPEAEYEKMIADNPYRPSKFWLPTPHEDFNNLYVIAWDRGKYYTLHKLLDYMREKQIPKALMVEFFREVTNQPEFHLEIEPINYPQSS